MAVDQEMVVHAWKDLSIQVLVLLSFTLQVVLLVLAEFRRRVNSGMLKFFVWSAYMLADGTAIYVLGHMAVTSRSSEHQLVAFWAPFLLLHLGGQDNITAYAIEDNRLWLRHLQTLVVQVATAAYVLFWSSLFTGGEQPWLRCAASLIFVVGAAKYGKRVWALWSANRSTKGNNYGRISVPTFQLSCQWKLLDLLLEGAKIDTERYTIMAHRMLYAPKNLLKESSRDRICYNLHGGHLYKVVEMQLFLMHDIFYTKAAVIHSNWYGILIHQISMVATATALVLFHRLVTLRDDYNKMDVVVTYVLLVGAVILETLSLLRGTFSSWTYSFLNRELRSNARIYLLHILFSVRRLVHAADWRPRYWSASMGQHNLLQMSARSRASRHSKIARRLGLEDLWNRHAYSWSIPVSAFIEDVLVKQLKFVTREMKPRGDEEEGLEWVSDDEFSVEEERQEGVPDDDDNLRDEEEGQGVPDDDDNLRDEEEGQGVPDDEEAEIEKVWGDSLPTNLEGRSNDIFGERVPKNLKSWRLYVGGLTRRQVEDRILIWHIATNIYLTWWYKEHGNKQQQPIKATRVTKAEEYKVEHSKRPNAELAEALSNYMVFLLGSRPDMISPTGSRNAYFEMCYALSTGGSPRETAEELTGILWRYGEALLNHSGTGRPDVSPRIFGFDIGGHYFMPSTLDTGCKLGAMLIRKHAVDLLVVDVIAQVWLQTLYFVAKNCSAYAHARQLSNGGELITICAILMEYYYRASFIRSPH